MIAANLKFYWLRLRNASIAELSDRLRQLLLIHFLKRGNIQWAPEESAIAHARSRDIFFPEITGGVDPPILEAILQGRTFYLSTDPRKLVEFQKNTSTVFWGDINPQAEPVDIRCAWEAARLQHLAILMACSDRSGFSSSHCLEFVKFHLCKWIGENPFPYGAHYMSVMESGLRIPVFLYALTNLKDLSRAEADRILSSLYVHAWWISKRLSLYSSLGNHTIAEAAGLVFGGVVFQNTEQGRRWLERGIGLLGQELPHQILDDGGPAEQSLGYHRFVLDLYWLVIGLLELNRISDCSEWKPRLMQGEKFLRRFEDGHGHYPAIGDSDDGHAFAPGLHPKCAVPGVEWETVTHFPDTGYTIFRPDHDVWLSFDHGPLGMPPFYNHGHADALSIVLFKKDMPFIVDPGTYRYNNEPRWRRYFKSTRCHNTVSIDDCDQAYQETGFIWSHPYRARLHQAEETERGYMLEASHDGYERLKKPVRHHRTLFINGNGTIRILDTFTGKGMHDFELNFHLHPEVIAFRKENRWILVRDQLKISLGSLDGKSFRLVKGQKEPILGWYSPAYGVKVETGVLTCRIREDVGRAAFTTLIRMEGD